MSTDESSSSKRQRVDLPPTTSPTEPAPTTTSPAVPPLPPPASLPPPRPPVLRGRPPIQRSLADLQAAAVRFTCPVCGKALQNAYKLDRHRRTHTGDLPFACAICEKRFSDSHNASRHQRVCAQRREVEAAMQTVRLSWPLWRQQPDEGECWEEEHEQDDEKDGADMSNTKRKSRANDEGAAALPRLNRWLFPQQHSDVADAKT